MATQTVTTTTKIHEAHKVLTTEILYLHEDMKAVLEIIAIETTAAIIKITTTITPLVVMKAGITPTLQTQVAVMKAILQEVSTTREVAEVQEVVVAVIEVLIADKSISNFDKNFGNKTFYEFQNGATYEKI